MIPGVHRRRRVLTIAVGLTLCASLFGVPAPAAAVPLFDEPISDPALAAEVEDARADSTRVQVEIVSTDTVAAARDARAFGGIVTGSVPGEVVQASVPAGNVEALGAAVDGYLQSPRRVNRPMIDQVEFGPTTGENVAVTNAATWHTAGITGAVKVGIVDFFDLGLWNPTEHGPLPDFAHRLCRDTVGAGFCPIPVDGINNGDGQEHGVAVAEVVRDMAPSAEIYIATVASLSDLRVAVDWFAANGVGIITRSLGAPYDGPGDGTGPLDGLVDFAASRGITWFNSAGNDAAGGYGRFTGGVTASGYVDFDNGPGVDDTLTIIGDTVGFDGIRWANDWGKPAGQVTDYAIEVYEPFAEMFVVDASQVGGQPPLELADVFGFPNAGRLDIRIKRNATGGDPSADIIEVALFSGELESGKSQAAYSAAKPPVDSRSPALVAVGAIDPAAGATIADYSSQGPTNDGRTKPDVSAASCLTSTIYRPDLYGAGACFNGTSAASPVAAGMAALLSSRGLAGNGVHLAALTKHLVADLGPPGPDLAFGTGRVTLPAPPPAAVDARPAQYVPLGAPQRVLDTRAGSPTPGAPIGPFAPFSLVDLPVGSVDGGATVSAVAISIASADSPTASYIQALPTLMGQLGAFANLNVAFPGQIKPNFAIVPVGAGGSISLYLPVGGNVVVDLMGYFTPAATPTVSTGRFIALTPSRVLDTRPGAGPVPPEWTPHKPAPSESVRITAIPAGAAAVVLNVTATEADGSGFLRTQPTGAGGLGTANGNYVAGTDSGTLSIVPVGSDGTVSILTSNSTHIVADLMGYITGPAEPPSREGLFVPITPARAFDSRNAPNTIQASLSTRTIAIAGLPSPAVPAGASAVSTNFAADAAVGPGYLTAFPDDGAFPVVSNLNYPTFSPISNAGLVRLASSGAIKIFVNQTTHVIIDVNGYFTGPS